MSTNFPLDAHQDSLNLALKARQAYAQGDALRGVDADESQEAFLAAWDFAREAGVVCGRHDLPAPFALSEVPALMAAFEDGEGEGYNEREEALEAALEAQGELFLEAA